MVVTDQELKNRKKAPITCSQAVRPPFGGGGGVAVSLGVWISISDPSDSGRGDREGAKGSLLELISFDCATDMMYGVGVTWQARYKHHATAQIASHIHHYS